MKKTFFILCILTLAGYASCSLVFPVYHIRYRLTVVIKSDDVEYRGSGVVDVSYRIIPDELNFAGGGTAFGGMVDGYAITVDLKKRGLIFVINDSSVLSNPKGTALYPDSASLTSLPFVAFGYQGYGEPSVMKKILKKFQGMRGSADVPNHKLPMLVRFPKPGATEKLDVLDPNKLEESLENTRIVKTTIEMTDDPISPIPAAWPDWLRAARFEKVEVIGTPLTLSGNILGGH